MAGVVQPEAFSCLEHVEKGLWCDFILGNTQDLSWVGSCWPGLKGLEGDRVTYMCTEGG